MFPPLVDPNLKPYVIVSRNNKGTKHRRLVLDETLDNALGVARANNTNAFWRPIKAEPATLADLWDALAGFDWYYMMSDDGRVYRAGERRKAELKVAVTKIPGGFELYEQWVAYINANTKGEPIPKPERPE